MPEFISCCNEPSRSTWLNLVARFKGKARVKSRRNITLKAKMESPEQIARLMTIKPGWNRNDGIQ
jgi:hypothetical protein